MRNLVQDGKRINITLAAAILSGNGLQIGDMLGVASVDGEIGDNIAFAIRQTYELPKATADAINAGDVVNWDASANGGLGEITSAATAAAGDVTACGVAMETVGAGPVLIAVQLTPGTGTGS